MVTEFVKGFVFNNTYFDEVENNTRLNLDVKNCQEELGLGDYNQEKDGKPSPAGRVYVNENDVRKCIENSPNSGYYTVMIPADKVTGKFADNLNGQIEYFNVEDFNNEDGKAVIFVGLSTQNKQYEITQQGIKAKSSGNEQSDTVTSGHQKSSVIHLPNPVRSR